MMCDRSCQAVASFDIVKHSLSRCLHWWYFTDCCHEATAVISVCHCCCGQFSD